MGKIGSCSVEEINLLAAKEHAMPQAWDQAARLKSIRDELAKK